MDPELILCNLQQFIHYQLGHIDRDDLNIEHEELIETLDAAMKYIIEREMMREDLSD